MLVSGHGFICDRPNSSPSFQEVLAGKKVSPMSKKTETIEVRVSPELKTSLSKVSEDRGQSMSETIRALVTEEIAQASRSLDEIGDESMAKAITSKWKHYSLSGAALIALALLWNGMTQPTVMAKAEVRMTFAELDLDDDGKITKSEFEAFVAKSQKEIERMTTDIESKLRLPEVCKTDFLQVLHGMPEEQFPSMSEFQSADRNKDNQLSYDELEAAMLEDARNEFKFLDQNKDGLLTLDEFRTDVDRDVQPSSDCEKELDALAESYTRASEKGTMAPETEVALETQEQARFARIMFAGMDANRDKKVDEDEYLASRSSSIQLDEFVIFEKDPDNL